MNSSMTLGFIVALGAGVAIGLQGLFSTITGQSFGLVRGGLVIHITGALVGALMVTVLTLTHPNQAAMTINARSLGFAFLAGTSGMCILIGIGYAFPRIGQVAGQGAVIFSQMLVAVLVDLFALGGGESVPLDGRRILGLLILGVGIYLLLPQQVST